MMVAAAMMLSYLEFLLPLNLMLPLPGFRLGLANLIVTLVFFRISPIDAGVISAIRILLTALLFGSATSLWFSALGGLLAYLSMVVCKYLLPKASFFGISVLAAACHNCGQILAAATLFGGAIIRSYLPALLFASVVYGGIVGTLLNLFYPRTQRVKI